VRAPPHASCHATGSAHVHRRVSHHERGSGCAQALDFVHARAGKAGSRAARPPPPPSRSLRTLSPRRHIPTAMAAVCAGVHLHSKVTAPACEAFVTCHNCRAVRVCAFQNLLGFAGMRARWPSPPPSRPDASAFAAKAGHASERRLQRNQPCHRKEVMYGADFRLPRHRCR
jgi:hypothetical protein